jgi:hypothetical protein
VPDGARLPGMLLAIGRGMRRQNRVLLGAMLGLFAGCAAPRVKLDEMSAAEHRREAARERAKADDHLVRYDPHAVEQMPGTRTLPGTIAIDFHAPFNPTVVQVEAADKHMLHAAEHERAAAALETFEDQACAGVPVRERASCPVLHPLRTEALADGVRYVLAGDAPLAELVARMRCHLAYARKLAYAKPASCPLYVKGVEIHPAKDAHAIEVTSTSRAVAAEIQTQSGVRFEPSR